MSQLFSPFFLVVFLFFFNLSPFFSFFVRYANCGNVRPTGMHRRNRKAYKRTKRSHDAKNIVFYSGGDRGNTYDSWAEAEFILIPTK